MASSPEDLRVVTCFFIFIGLPKPNNANPVGRGIVTENYDRDSIADHAKPNPPVLAVLFANVRLDQEWSAGREHSRALAKIQAVLPDVLCVLVIVLLKPHQSPFLLDLQCSYKHIHRQTEDAGLVSSTQATRHCQGVVYSAAMKSAFYATLAEFPLPCFSGGPHSCLMTQRQSCRSNS